MLRVRGLLGHFAAEKAAEKTPASSQGESFEDILGPPPGQSSEAGMPSRRANLGDTCGANINSLGRLWERGRREYCVSDSYLAISVRRCGGLSLSGSGLLSYSKQLACLLVRRESRVQATDRKESSANMRLAGRQNYL